MPTPTPSGTASQVPSNNAWVRVSVATLWRSPNSVRAVDAPAIGYPARIRDWLTTMTLAQRRQLVGRIDSQLLLGERVVILQKQGAWAHVVVPDQPTPLDARGYPGWLPIRQLAFTAPAVEARDATVIRPTAWMYDAGRRVETSFATRLPMRARDAIWVVVDLPDGKTGRLHPSDVIVTARGAAAVQMSGGDLVRTAEMFRGLPYLWAGTSGFGFDCSGLMQLDFRVHGRTIARDADAEALHGTPVARHALQPGDLLFYATASGYIHHVSMYVGNGEMVQSPQTGSAVEVVSVTSQPLAGEYWGARRYW